MSLFSVAKLLSNYNKSFSNYDLASGGAHGKFN